MKILRNNTVRNALFSIAVLLVALSFTTGCYQTLDTRTGSISLNAVSVSRTLTTAGGSANVWVVGLVIDSSFETQLKELLVQDDLRKENNGSLDTAKDIWIDLAMKSTVKFDGGRPFFQYSMPRINPLVTMPATGSFTITGIPANKSYFLYLMVLAKPFSSIDDFTDAPLAVSPVHYFDPSTAPEGYVMKSSQDHTVLSTPLKAGWYSFTVWKPSNFVNDTYTVLNAEVWTDASGKPISSQPFSILPGASDAVNVLLEDW